MQQDRHQPKFEEPLAQPRLGSGQVPRRSKRPMHKVP